MNTFGKIVIALVIIVAVGTAAILWKKSELPCCQRLASSNAPTPNMASADANEKQLFALPTLYEFGSVNCKACKAMQPIIDDLAATRKDKLRVIFIDVNKEPDLAMRYNIQAIPTQIFLSPDKKELFRHVGFFAKEDILAKWAELGYQID